MCPLCLNKNSQLQTVAGPDHQEYHLCHICKLIFSPTQFHLGLQAERKRYETHQNGLHQKGYVDFLNRTIQPALLYLNSSMQGLDYGCGPGPTLSQLLGFQNIACEDYDPIFFPTELKPGYDFIFSTECFEHFYYPEKEISRLYNLLIDNGYLIIMTDPWETVEQFKTWYYAKDPTHVCFYHKTSFDYICKKFGFLSLPCNDARVFILPKQNKVAIHERDAEESKQVSN